MQRRPLHMIIAKGPGLKPLYAHCLGGGTKPRITVTTHPAADGQWVWYMGGDIAESRRRGSRAGRTDRHRAKGNRPIAAMDRPQHCAMGDLARGPRRAAAIRPDPSGQRISRRGRSLAGRLADQTGTGARLRRPRYRLAATRRHPAAGHRSAAAAAKTADGRTRLGATAAMSLTTLHELHRPLGSTGLTGFAAGPGHGQTRPRPRGEIPQRLSDSRR